MNIYLFGNPDHSQDDLAFRVADQLKQDLPKLKFIYIKPNQDLPFVDQNRIVMMDVVMGIDKVTLITKKNLDKLVLPPRTSAHDFDLAFQLKYLQKLDKIEKFVIIGLPMSEKVDLEELKKLIKNL